MINTASLVPTGVDDTGDLGVYLEALRTKMQQTAVAIYLHSLHILDGKRGIIRGGVMSKAIDYGTRNVITSDSSRIERIGQGNHLRFNSIGVGLYQHAKAINPIAIGELIKTMSNIFSAHQKNATVLCVKDFKKSLIDLNNKMVNLYTTEKGLNKYLNKFKDNSFAKAIFGVGDVCFAAIHDDGENVRLVYDSDGLDISLLRPATNIEVLFITLAHTFDTYYASTTRFPAINQGSTYPVKPTIKPTLKMITRNIESDGHHLVAYNYPRPDSDIFDSMSPHHTKLDNAGADFDGDTMSYVVYWSDESNDEVKRILNDRAFYIGADNKLAYSVDTDILRYVVSSIHKAKEVK